MRSLRPSFALSLIWSSMFWISRMWFLTIIASLSSTVWSDTLRFIAFCISLPCSSLSRSLDINIPVRSDFSLTCSCSSLSSCLLACTSSLLAYGSSSIALSSTFRTARSILSPYVASSIAISFRRYFALSLKMAFAFSASFSASSWSLSCCPPTLLFLRPPPASSAAASWCPFGLCLCPLGLSLLSRLLLEPPAGSWPSRGDGFGIAGSLMGAPMAIWDFRSKTSWRSWAMMFWYCTTCISVSTTFCCTLVLMSLARLAYLRELTVSSYWLAAGDTFAIITVLQFPPNESLSSLVSFESL
mmetsp:Transcript_7689/g.18701  ORF Transcript_7689/g.18701 Transcript_7689/m.18701 type:complete len:300 (-) Transcript_7689:115-1014(-)